TGENKTALRKIGQEATGRKVLRPSKQEAHPGVRDGEIPTSTGDRHIGEPALFIEFLRIFSVHPPKGKGLLLHPRDPDLLELKPLGAMYRHQRNLWRVLQRVDCGDKRNAFQIAF